MPKRERRRSDIQNGHDRFPLFSEKKGVDQAVSSTFVKNDEMFRYSDEGTFFTEKNLPQRMARIRAG